MGRLSDEGGQAEQGEQEACLGDEDEAPSRASQWHQRCPENLDCDGQAEDRHHLGDARIRNTDVLERNGQGFFPDRRR